MPRVIHVTAKSATLDGKRILTLIDGNKDYGYESFDDKPSKLVIEFVDPISHIDFTCHFLNYSAPISIEGLGFFSPDVRNIINLPFKHTYQFDLPAIAKGILTIETQGGTGLARLYDVSSFLIQP